MFVTEYVTPGDGIKGILKARFSDFHVNEIDLDGKEAVLTDVSIPQPPKDAEYTEEELVQLITKDKVDEIRKVAESQEKGVIVEIDVTEMSKQDRGSIHNIAKSIFGNAVVGSTVTREDKKFITFAKYDKKIFHDRREKWPYPEDYTHFILFKENLDTFQATGQLTEILRVSPSAFAYAGTKDRRAKTTQWVSIKRGDPLRIVSAASKNRNMKLGNFCFKPEPLKLGMLRGNRFRIVIRKVTASEEEIKTSMENFRENGFINYFGLQRFGNCAEVPTYKVGIEILKNDWKKACILILKPREGDPYFMKKIREIWVRTGDAKLAYEKFFYSNKSIERSILKWLSTHGNDFKGAIDHLPRNMRLLYTHSYQSLVWNRVASRRLKDLGYHLVPGDLVFADKSIEEEIVCEPVLEAETAIQQTEEKETPEPEESEQSPKVSHFKSLVKPLTEADIESGQYTIFDIVLPLPGHDITYPSNECAKWYEEILAEDGFSSEKLKLKTKMHSLAGAYRKVFIKPENLDWKVVGYKFPSDTLILSDYEKLKKAPEPVSVEDAPYQALLLDFRLPSSSYATMALREILKVDTSAMFQRTLEEEDDMAKLNELVTAGTARAASTEGGAALEQEAEEEDWEREAMQPLEESSEKVADTPDAGEEHAEGEEPAEKRPKLD